MKPIGTRRIKEFDRIFPRSSRGRDKADAWRELEADGELVCEETIPPPCRERTPDPDPEVVAKARYRDGWARTFGTPKLPGKVDP